MLLPTMLFALTLQAAEPWPSVETEREIVAIDNKVKAWRARVYEKRGKVFCQTKVSSGYKHIDAISCTAMTTCLTDLRSRVIASADRKLKAAERKTLNVPVSKDMLTCMMSRREALIAEWVERRFEARQGSN